jgi:hypothetical protein
VLLARARRVHRAVATLTTAQWRDRPGLAGGQGVARLAGTPRESNNGCTGQGGVVGFSPKTAGGGGVEKRVRCEGVLR